jgi:hypothetical protein
MISEVKSKTIAFRVSPQDFDSLSRLATYLHPHLLAKEYTFAFSNIIIKMHNLTQTSAQDQGIAAKFRLATVIAAISNKDVRLWKYNFP